MLTKVDNDLYLDISKISYIHVINNKENFCLRFIIDKIEKTLSWDSKQERDIVLNIILEHRKNTND